MENQTGTVEKEESAAILGKQSPAVKEAIMNSRRRIKQQTRTYLVMVYRYLYSSKFADICNLT